MENVAAANEYHWMAPNFLKYAGPLTANDLPVDANELFAMCAPRPVFVGGGVIKMDGPWDVSRADGWADARGMFLAEVGAGPVYTLLGKKGLGTAAFPATGTALIDGDLAISPAPIWSCLLAELAYISHLCRSLHRVRRRRKHVPSDDWCLRRCVRVRAACFWRAAPARQKISRSLRSMSKAALPCYSSPRKVSRC